jgi:hypothetical protein
VKREKEEKTKKDEPQATKNFKKVLTTGEFARKDCSLQKYNIRSSPCSPLKRRHIGMNTEVHPKVQ